MEHRDQTATPRTSLRRKRALIAAIAIPAFALIACAAQADPTAPTKNHPNKAHHAAAKKAAKKPAVALAADPAKPAPLPAPAGTWLHFDWRAVPAPVSPYDPKKYMSGDWGGERTRLHNMGVDVRMDMVNESGANVAGGKSPGTAYAQQLGAGFSVDTVKAFGWQNGGLFAFYMTDRAGSPLSPYTQGTAPNTGNGLEPLQIFGQGQNFRLSQLWYDQPFFEDKASLRVGFYPYGNEFGTSRVWYNFVNTNFCAHMQSMPADSKGWYDAPRGAWTARVKLTPTDNFYAMAAITTFQPQLTGVTHGWDLGLENSKGYNIPAEMGYLWGLNPTDLDGSFKLGGYFDSVHGDTTLLYKGATYGLYQYGVYAMFEQQVFRTNGTGDQGLRVFASGLIGDHTTALWQNQVSAGATWRGTFAGRENDTVSFAVSYVTLNNSWVAFKERTLGVPVKNNFTTLELNYGVQLTPWLNFKPFAQLQTNPGALVATKASERYANSKVIGLETKFVF